MKRYLAHLLADLETAARHAPEPSSYAFRTPFRDEEEERAAGVLHTRYIRLCDLFGLPADAFPPVERLTKLQVTEVLTALETLWRAWKIDWECPTALTARRRYTLMVQWMYRETVPYHHDFGAEIDFCCYREQGVCPFGSGGRCSCQEMEDLARHDVEIWEEYHREQQEGASVSPVQDLYNWLRQDEPCLFEWECDETRDRWKNFVSEEDLLAWLYFYRPDVSAELNGEEPEPTPEDFEDFDWKEGRSDRDDEFPLPF